MRVAALALLDRGVDPRLDEVQPRLVVELARRVAVGGGGGDEGDDGDEPGVGQHARHARHAARVLVAVGGREAEVAAEAVADVLAVEQVGGPPARHQRALQLLGDRRLARGGQAGQPDGGAAQAEHRPALAPRQRRLVPDHVRAVRAGRRAGVLVRLEHHAGRDGGVGRLVDEDEGAGDAVALVRLGHHRRGEVEVDEADVVERELARVGDVLEPLDVEPRVDRLDPRAHAARGVLEHVAGAGRGRRVGHPAQPRLEPAGDRRGVAGRADQVAAAGVDVVGEHDGDRLRRDGLLDRPVEGVDAGDRGALALREHEHLVAGPQDAAGHLAGGAAVVGRAHDPLDGQPRVVEVAVGRHLELLEVGEDRRPVVPRRLVRRLDHVVAVQRRDRDHAAVGHAEPLHQLGEVALDGAEAGLVPVDQVHLVHAADDVADAEQRGQVGVAARLLDDAVAGVDQHDGDVGGAGPGDHVARVADVARGVGDDERAPRGGEEAVGDVDRDALLALGAQPVGQPREIDLGVVDLVGHQRLGVVEQPADQGRLAVVDRAGGGEPDEVGHLEVALALAVLHGGLRRAVVGAGGAALGDARGDASRRSRRRRRSRASGPRR